MVCLDFADGGICKQPRSFLVIDTDFDSKEITLLNVSSVRKKEHKLLYSSNELIQKYNPPFYLRSFVKLDAIYTIDYFPALDEKLMAKGNSLEHDEFIKIEDKFNAYHLTNTCVYAKFEEEKVKQLNGI